MDYSRIAERLTTALQLDNPPIGLAFVTEQPDGIPESEDAAPSACSFWPRASSAVFYARAEDHLNCPVGAMTLGFDLPPAVQEDLMAAAQRMIGCGYLQAQEVEKLPGLPHGHQGIVYGPLADLPLPPRLALLWLSPYQAMIAAEAAGSCRWTEQTPTIAPGRPACAVIPLSLLRSRPTLSLGCIGMRTFTQVSDGLMLAALPADQLQEFVDALEAVVHANGTMREFYEGRREAVAGA